MIKWKESSQKEGLRRRVDKIDVFLTSDLLFICVGRLVFSSISWTSSFGIMLLLIKMLYIKKLFHDVISFLRKCTYYVSAVSKFLIFISMTNRILFAEKYPWHSFGAKQELSIYIEFALKRRKMRSSSY